MAIEACFSRRLQEPSDPADMSEEDHIYNFHDGCFRPSLGLLQTQAYSALVRSRRCYEIGRNPLLDRQPDPGLTGAHGLIATTPEPNAENRGAVCS